MISNLINSFLNDLPAFLLSLPIILFALSAHETAHGYVAYRLGDPTARNLGRLTLNPLKHLDPIGFLCMVFFHFGGPSRCRSTRATSRIHAATWR